MLNLAVCDDNKEDLKRIKEFVSMYSIKQNIDFKTYYFNNIIDLEMYIERTDLLEFILLLDIQIGVNNGINWAKSLRDKYGSKIQSVIFISNYPDFVFGSFKAHPDGYLCKPIKYEDLQNVLSTVIINIKKAERKQQLILVKDLIDGHTEIIPESQIIAIQVINSYERSISITTPSKVIIVHNRLNDLMGKLNEKHFFQSYRSVIINLQWIKSIKSKSVEMSKGEQPVLPLSRLKRKNLIDKLDNYIMDRMDKND